MSCRPGELDLDGDEALAAFVADVRATYAEGPPPAVGPDLSAVLTAGLAGARPGIRPIARPVPVPDDEGVGSRRLRGRRARLALGAAVAGLSLLGTGVAGALPGPAQRAFERTAEAIGIDLPARTQPEDLPDVEVPPSPSPSDDGSAPIVDGPPDLGSRSGGGSGEGGDSSPGEEPNPSGSVPPAPGRNRPAAGPGSPPPPTAEPSPPVDDSPGLGRSRPVDEGPTVVPGPPAGVGGGAPGRLPAPAPVDGEDDEVEGEAGVGAEEERRGPAEAEGRPEVRPAPAGPPRQG